MRQSDFDLSSQALAEPAPVLARGATLGRFLVLGLVGRGAMGEVYGAYDPDLDRKIAIKLLRPRAGEAVDHRARLMREAKATAKISHPNVVVVYDAGTFVDRVFIAMEFIEGHTLRFWLQVQEREWHEVLDVFLAAGRGLAAAHDKELVHRDFKPDNVMVTTLGGQVRVMDFGLARFTAPDATNAAAAPIDLDGTIELSAGQLAAGAGPGVESPSAVERLTQTGAVLGTPAYMSPEQFRSLQADARSDQFSFCVALYEALYAERPFAGRTLQELSENVIAGRLGHAGAAQRVPAALRSVLARGLRADPGERFPTMRALLDELGRHASAGRTSFAGGAAAKLRAVWEAPVEGHPVESREKEAMRSSFLATGKPYASATFTAASHVLDRYAQRWTDLYVESCEATHVRGEQSAEVLDLRMACLNEGLDDLRALCRLFGEATGQVVENAVKAAQALGTLERCQDVKLLRAVMRPPEDAASRQAVEGLRLRLVEVRALQRVGKLAAGLEAVGPLVEEARQVGYLPMLAEVLFTKGTLHTDAVLVGNASELLEEAFAMAVEARHDEIAATAAIYLIYQKGYVEGNVGLGETWSRYAQALLNRMGARGTVWGWYLSARADLRQQQGRIAEAIEDTRQAIAAHERASGPRSTEIAMTMGNLANHMALAGDFDNALVVVERALAIFGETLGPDHPRVGLYLGNKAQFLCRLGRFEEAIGTATGALAILERELGPRGLTMTFPLRTIGLGHLGCHRPKEAIPVLERALALREELGVSPLRLAELRFPLARALAARGGRGGAALAMAQRALGEYEESPRTPVAEKDLAELRAWLAARNAKVRKRPAVVKPRRAKAKRTVRRARR